jgi:hypothetical protein
MKASDFLKLYESTTSGDFVLHIDGAGKNDWESLKDIFTNGITKQKAYTGGPSYSLSLLHFDFKKKLVKVHLNTSEPMDSQNFIAFVLKEFANWTVFTNVFCHVLKDSINPE